jgi:hypothetical protein
VHHGPERRNPRSVAAPTKTIAALSLVSFARVSSCDPVGSVEGPGTRSYDAQAYSVTAQFDWQARRLKVNEVVTLRLAPCDELVRVGAELIRR